MGGKEGGMKRTGKTTKAVLGGVVLLLVFTLVDHVAALTATYDAFVDFSFASNPTPNGLWQYGFTPPGADGPLTLYTHRDSPIGLSAWRDATDPNVIKNETGNDLVFNGEILFPATDFLHFHPGPNGERSVVRWTAPAAGAYQIAAVFRGLRIDDGCGQTVDVHVLHNGTELYRADISSSRDVRSFFGTRTIAVGDIVDFQVGQGPDSYICDSTGLKATITLLDAVVPTNVNDLVTFVPLSVTFKTTANRSGCPAGFVGKFRFTARLTDKSTSPPLADLKVEVVTLTNGNLLQNADDGPGDVGAVLTVSEQGQFADGVLSAEEFVDVPFVICLKRKVPFTFFVDVLGVVQE
jgi:hypothetical protein